VEESFFTKFKYIWWRLSLLQRGCPLKQTNKTVCILTCILATASMISSLVPPAFAIDTTVKINPLQTTVYINGTFSVNVTLQNVTNLYGWEFWLYWNRTIVNCTQAVVNIPSVWADSHYSIEPAICNDYNETHGRCVKLLSALYPAPTFNGTMTLTILTFKALKTGVAVLDFEVVKLSDNNWPPPKHPQPIAHVVLDGSVTVLPPPLYMRSDQHTVNNATTYKLVENHTQTAASVNSSVTDPENEAYCYWGVRVWKRSSAGTETEITSGSPVAVVSRTSSGSGLQSANWTCPTTNLSITDCLVVRVYYKFDWTNYTQCSQFITLQLNATLLEAGTWTVYYYTQRSYNSGTHKTYIYYYWDNNYNSRTENTCYN